MSSSTEFEAIKSLIFEASAQRPEIGPLEESVKWGQTSFAPKKAGIGSSVRIEARQDGSHALMFICTTGLVEHFVEMYGPALPVEGKRAILMPHNNWPQRDMLKHCIQMALTHKLAKRAS